jgi:hypothetical protein
MQLLLPCEDMELRLEASNRQFFRVSRQERLPRDMELDMVNILIGELKTFKELDRITYDLEQRPDYNSLACFRAVDRANEGRLDLINLKKFFQMNSIFLTDREVLALIRRLDTTADQAVSHDELRDYIEQQVGFRSGQAMKSLAQGTPEARTEFHHDLQANQMNAVTIKPKIFGHEQNPMYDKSPQRINSRVLEQRVFMTKENQRRPKTTGRITIGRPAGTK